MKQNLTYRKIQAYQEELWAIAEFFESQYRFNSDVHEKKYVSIAPLYKEFKSDNLYASLDIIEALLKGYGFKAEARGVRNAGKLDWKAFVKYLRKELDIQEPSSEGILEINIEKNGILSRSSGSKIYKADFLTNSKRFKFLLLLAKEKAYISTHTIAELLKSDSSAVRTLVKEINKKLNAKLVLSDNLITSNGEGYHFNSRYSIRSR